MITVSKRISSHFHSTEFRCKCGCGKIYIEEELVNKLEKLFSKLNASKGIISSGYRCYKHDKTVGGSGYGQHTKGLAADCCYYDKNGKQSSQTMGFRFCNENHFFFWRDSFFSYPTIVRRDRGGRCKCFFLYSNPWRSNASCLCKRFPFYL